MTTFVIVFSVATSGPAAPSILTKKAAFFYSIETLKSTGTEEEFPNRPACRPGKEKEKKPSPHLPLGSPSSPVLVTLVKPDLVPGSRVTGERLQSSFWNGY